MASFSISAYGPERCTGFCAYCCAGSTINYTMGVKKDLNHLIEVDNYVFEHQYKRDWEKVKQTLLNDPQIRGKSKEQLAKENVHFDLWGGDPVANFRMVKDMVENLTKICQEIGFGSWNFSDSTNGIALLRDDICEWHEKNKVGIQLSHDGLGQWIRTKDIEPLEYENTKRLIKNGTLRAINTTLNFYNPNMVDNYLFWTNYLKGLFPNIYSKDKVATKEETAIFDRIYIKLNHIYNGDYSNKKQNTMGIFEGKYYPQLVNTEFGDFNFVNDHERAEKYGIPEMAHVLDDYLHSYRMLIPMMGDLEFMPFYSYVSEQLKRYRQNPDTEAITGACRAYQRYRHDIGEKRSQRDYTFVIDTMGNYCECNLLYSKYSVDNPGGIQPSYCKDCKYKTQSECMTCGSQRFPERCHYQYPWVQFLEEVRSGIYMIPKRFNVEKQINSWTPEMKKAMEEMHKRGL